MRKFCLLIASFVLLGFSYIQAQTVQITGTVTSAEDGQPVIGASVVVKGTTIGTATDIDGRYSLDVPQSATTLEFSFIGLLTQGVVIGGRTVIDVVLQSDATQLEEVIVVAYGTVKREGRTGSISTVNNETIAELPASSVDKLLTGKMAGVQITGASGQPGADSQIRIRGTSSINAGSEPLWVIDGIPVMRGNQSYFTNTGNALAAINPNDIESITVLKDAAAASVYGSRAANGVILVTTKSGSSGKAKFNARTKFGVSQLANDNNFGLMNGEELLSFQRNAVINAGLNPDDPSGAYYRPMSLLDGELTNWMDHFTRLGQMQEYEINAAGGTDKSKFYTSLSYHKNEGVYYGVDFQKFNARVNTDYKLTDKLEVGARMNIGYTETNDVAMQLLYYANPAFAGMTIQPWTPAYNEDGTHSLNIPENSYSNPRFTAEYDDQFEKQYRFQGSYFLSWKPIDGLEIKSNNAGEGTFGEGRRYWAPDYGGTTGTLQSSSLKYIQLTTSNTITYSKILNEVHSLRALAGQEAMRRTYNAYYIYSPDVDVLIPYPNTSTAEGDEGNYLYNARTLMSFFGILDYNYASKYYLQASMRYDGSSLFGADNRWGLFWSLGGSWNIHNEDFMKDVTLLNLLKFRASFGINGNDNINAYQAYGVYASTAYNGGVGMRPSSPTNNNLSWEKNSTFNVGLDFGLFDGKLNGSIDAYNRITEDMLLSKQVHQTSGFSTNFMNIGSLLNQGIEFQMDGQILKTNNIVWSAGFNVAYNRTELLDLGDTDEMTYVRPVDNETDPRLKHKVGMSMYTFYLKDYYGVNPSTGQALWRAEDGQLTSDFNKAAWIYAGSPEPKFIGGINTSVSWKGLSLGAFLEFKQGNKVLIIENRFTHADGNYMSMNQAKSALNYWKQPGDTGVNPKPIAGQSTNSYNTANTRWLEDGSYVRIKDLSLSYTLPQNLTSQMKLGGMKVYVSAMNLYTFHDVNFWDPERGVDGMGFGIYPMTKSFIGGIELSF
ncbi:SusC/RagA family TonB-linked outer membrane protein [Perlabentimonas gracilis]|uniref:SusC/RagA family TonB-linked outer membrane protein n=1 Tax=Perlabentimonas gracilis TaxID=2715279 RepID=UPI00140DEE3A|nr:TonB-dependent receptor [Perlabentimonas gracilis]NHB68719.1 TonB-dependent receptor [Perlabentimonas gracilis]